ncbi:3-keto-disaccharide hydrolase [Lignipirellula cremea]|uniref:3-keto-alpha-glucoside-1,2-lyase/3-keto-2-hydroxy-glucal hydratase domain-containing protein n=1 Tax=Lignipirellula cremea TaxID=2528010 RepID=A0A518DN97_9BACT|nr:DUF1080 domain-containing protein [Lignipirellula cremea]QDU93312.1 hypothetical protein Pla8534_10920 [Lignipirellula cremea]
MKRVAAGALLAVLVLTVAARAAETEKGFTQLFDGKTFTGWKANEAADSWKIEDGALVCEGPRSHLFYTGDLAPFKNFELKVDVMTTPGSNAGIYFHSQYQESGWPKHGYEAQVNNTHGDPKKTGSLYAVMNVMEAPAKDNEWFTEEIIVQGKRIIIKVNGKTLVDFTEEADRKPGSDFTRILSEGTFALQAHDPKSKVLFKNIRVKKLAD